MERTSVQLGAAGSRWPWQWPLLLAVVLFVPADPAHAVRRVLDDHRYHLRSGGTAEWEEFAGRTPHSNRLELRFTAASNATAGTLFIRQNDVKQDWSVELNGRRLGKLFLMESPLVHSLPVPPGALRDGTNRLSILPPRANDDIVVGGFELDSRPLAEALGGAKLEVEVTEAGSGRGLPCRITVSDRDGVLTALTALPAAADSETSPRLAVRPGVVYTADGRARLGLLPGDYTVQASRGFEFGLATQAVAIARGQTQRVRLELRREVPTPGLVSCDTHIHTFTFSKHGDATLEERMLTLAGEGIELPISTEHNQLVDFTEAARNMQVAEFFTPVVGAEVTTRAGHFNAFPIERDARAPDHTAVDWPALMQNIRTTPGVRAIVLNHPCDVHSGFTPFGPTNFNRLTGENLRGFAFSFDAVELVNSGALRTDLMEPHRAWFALLNHGYRVTGVGASDSHDVSRFIVGQGRTYLVCPDGNAGQLDAAAAVDSLRQGRALVSLGLLTDLTVDDRHRVGDLATGLGETLRVEATVRGPAWTHADRVELFANGVRIREERLEPTARIEKARLTWNLPRPAHDAHLVAIASGPGVRSPHWAIPRPYQPSSPAWEPRVLGSTNPIWLDADGDGRFTPARAYAEGLIGKTGGEPARLLPALAAFDETVSVQAASLCRARGLDLAGGEFAAALRRASPAVQRGFAAYAESLREQ